MPTVTAIEPHDGYKPGSKYQASEQRAKELIAKGLVKMKGPSANKMQPENRSNKKSPTAAGGGASKSSASPAARASQKTTANKSASGEATSQTDDE